MTLLRFKRKIHRLWLLQLIAWSDMSRGQVWYEDGELGLCPSRHADKHIFRLNKQLELIKKLE